MFWPSDEEVREAIRQRPFYWTGRHEQRMFILKSLEESYPSKERGDLDSIKELSIEHVLPQTPTAPWLEMVSTEIPQDEDPTEVAHRIMHTLGNLTITGYNPELTNDPFPRKRELLRQSKLEMNLLIAARETWGPGRSKSVPKPCSSDSPIYGRALTRRNEPPHPLVPGNCWTKRWPLFRQARGRPLRPSRAHRLSSPTGRSAHRQLSDRAERTPCSKPRRTNQPKLPLDRS